MAQDRVSLLGQRLKMLANIIHQQIPCVALMVVAPLDKLDEPPSLRLLRSSVSRRMPQADLPEVLLEIHRRTGFANDFTHISEAEARADDLDISICAVLLAQACNVGFAPLINPRIPALTRERLSWVQQNYLRAETIMRSNTRLVDAHSTNGLAQRWGLAVTGIFWT